MAIHFRRQTSSVSWKKRLPASWHADFPLSQWGRSECGKHVFFQVAKDQRGVVCILHISGRSDFPLILQSSHKQLAKVSCYYLLHKRQILAFTDEAARIFFVTLQPLRLHSHIWKFSQRTNESVVGSVAVCVLTAMRRVKAASSNVSWHLVQDSGDRGFFGGARFDQ